MSLNITHVPSVKELHPAVERDGLIVTGYAATWDLDRVGDVFDPYSLDSAVKAYMSTNPVLMYQHKYDLPPIGKVLKAEIHRARGLWIEALMPRPKDGTRLAEVWNAAKDGLLKAFSVGGRWLRKDQKTHHAIVDADLVEISLCATGVNPAALTDSVKTTEVKCITPDLWLPADQTDFAHLANQLDLAELRLTVAEMLMR